jgi:DNA-binding NtrC family response regulator/tetratricopeptide (TPR) repeat protein
METAVHIELTRIESGYLDKGMPQQALVALANIDPSCLSGTDLTYYLLLKSEAKLRVGQYDVDSFLFEAMAIHRSLHDSTGFAQAKYLSGWHFCCLGRFSEAQETLLESYVFFKNCGDKPGMARVLNRLAYLNEQNGKMDMAMENLKQSILINRELKRSEWVLKSEGNLAQAYLRAGLIDGAITELLKIKQEFVSIDDGEKCKLSLRLALAKAVKGEVDEAVELMEEAERNICSLKREEALYYEYLGWIYNLVGRYVESLKVFKMGIQLSLKLAPESTLISQTGRLLADAYVGLSRFGQAEKEAQRALAVAEKINERAEIAGCYRVFAQVEAYKGNKEKALEWFKKAMDIYAMISSRYELAVTRYLAATSGLYGDGECMAMLYMAREYFKSEGIKHYVEKVDAKMLRSTRPMSQHRISADDRHVYIAVHPKSRRIVELAEHIAPSDLTVFITGPTGVGKDQLAKHIHFCSGRKGELVTVNSAAVQDGLIESELFGFKKGAFTGAHADKAGLFEAADKGTMYLNEIADASPGFQAKLLEVIESKCVRRIGETQIHPVDVRIIAATNHDLDQKMKQGQFRMDLYYRLTQIHIAIPPLSERIEDLIAFVEFFLKMRQNENCNQRDNRIRCGGKDVSALAEILAKRDWPGNVRQLKAEIDRLFVMASGDVGAMLSLLREGDLSEREILEKALEETNWNRSEAARELGVAESTIRNHIKQYGLRPKRKS